MSGRQGGAVQAYLDGGAEQRVRSAAIRGIAAPADF
jgi:hypothetical protein